MLSAICRKVTLLAMALALTATASAFAVDYVLPVDDDGDGVANSADSCRSVAGDLRNGCPSKLAATVRGRWRGNALLTQLLSLSVRAPTGSKIDVRCSACSFNKRVITRTTKRTTALTRYFKGRRILRAGVMITVRVTRARQIGVYQRLVTRTGRRLPRVTNRCVSTTGRVQGCS